MNVNIICVSDGVQTREPLNWWEKAYIYKIILKEESEWGWGTMKWTEEKTGRGWGVKGVTERERGESKDLKLLMGKEGRGGMSKHVGEREREGGLCGLRLP